MVKIAIIVGLALGVLAASGFDVPTSTNAAFACPRP